MKLQIHSINYLYGENPGIFYNFRTWGWKKQEKGGFVTFWISVNVIRFPEVALVFAHPPPNRKTGHANCIKGM